jgi:SH3 domain-containing YSC84-like protein 1
MKRTRSFLLATAPLLLAGVLVGTPVLAADAVNQPAPSNATSPPANQDTATNTHHKQEAQQLINAATAEVNKMSKDPKLKQLMAKAKGIYLVPEFGRGALIVGGRGGAGVVLAKNNGKWSDPAFYDFGAISIGAQAGASGGEVAFLLMTDNAVDAFKSGNKISLNAEAGLSIVDYSGSAQASWGKGDIIMWSDTAGLYAGGTISVSDLNWADNNNQAYYGRKVQPDQILAGQVNTPDASQLKDALQSS